MTKFWRVVAHEYTRHVLRRRFLFALLSVPLMVAVMALTIFLLVRLETDDTPVGYVDRSGLLANPVSPPAPSSPGRPVPLIPYQTGDQARSALESGEIQAYYLLPPDYLQTGRAELVYLDEPSESAKEQFEAFVRANLLRDQPAGIAHRVTEGADVIVRSPDGSREFSKEGWVNVLTPFIAGLAFVITIFSTSGYLMQAVVEEKENRTMEILVTSVSPGQLMGGKIIGITGVGLTQLLVWIAFAVVGVAVGRNYFAWLAAIRLAPGPIALMVVVLAPAYVMIAALMAAVGATVTEAREGQQMTALFTLPVVAPYWLTGQILSNPNSPLAVGLSLFPLTAPVTITLRAGLASIPGWQIALNVLLLAISAAGGLWLAGRAFRLGMLRYGRRLSWREVFGRPG